MFRSNTIRLFWWSEPKLMGKSKENYGDLIGKYLVEKISNKRVVWVNPKTWHFIDYFQPIYFTAGSILAHVNKKCVVWGSGIIQKNQIVTSADFLAVRGPKTRQNLLNQGFDIPEIYGDPALLMPDYYSPSKNKVYSIGFVPHYTDYELVYSWYKNEKDVIVIDLMTNNIEVTTDLFLQCERIISSSLHGLIVSHAYGIPAIWVKFSDKLFGDGIKFQDYFESVGIKSYIPLQFNTRFDKSEIEGIFLSFESNPDDKVLDSCKKALMSVCPFKE